MVYVFGSQSNEELIHMNSDDDDELFENIPEHLLTPSKKTKIDVNRFEVQSELDMTDNDLEATTTNNELLEVVINQDLEACN